jgi:PadR family transcriptional regulator PadR
MSEDLTKQEQGSWFDNWVIQLRKGLLEYCILRALAGGEWYGYALVKALVNLPGLGVSEGSIYPLLSRLRKQGLVTTRLEESKEGPARKYYQLTPSGTLQEREMSIYYAQMIRGVELLTDPALRSKFSGN